MKIGILFSELKSSWTSPNLSQKFSTIEDLGKRNECIFVIKDCMGFALGVVYWITRPMVAGFVMTQEARDLAVSSNQAYGHWFRVLPRRNSMSSPKIQWTNVSNPPPSKK